MSGIGYRSSSEGHLCPEANALSLMAGAFVVAEVPMDVIRVTDQTTRTEIEEAIGHVLASMRRLPCIESFQARGHAKIDDLLIDWEAARFREAFEPARACTANCGPDCRDCS